MASPAMYDPYNYVSFVELNKRKRGDYYDRPESQRLENRTNRPAVKRIYLKKNGDDSPGKPKLYIWRQLQAPSLDQLTESAGDFVGLHDAMILYDRDGRRIMHEEDIHENGTYYVAGDESFDPPAESIHHKSGKYSRDGDDELVKEDELLGKARDYEDAYREALSTPALSIITDQPSTSRKQETEPNGYDYYSNERHARSAKTRGKDDYYDDYDRRYSGGKSRGREFDDYDDYDSRNKQHSAPAAYHREKYSSKPKSRRARSTSSAKRELEDSMISDFHDDEAELRDRLALEKHKQKNRYARSHSAQIFNRKDQTNPNAYIIYVFLNGNGMDCQYVDFSRSQLEKGMPYVLELCARKYKVNPARLVNMDGKKIVEVSDMMSRGAYVLIPVGQNFRDTWYFLPDNAIDTSADVDKVRARSAQRDRYIQKKERDDRRKTSHKRSKSSDYR
ncbi:unnamed protein product, partial [Mesorhabditis belari]|uniref:Doublecortin domain-containing protein n=1 Tax=Mesorhabditis belari TaxID=2138241 RepID=A0AAF3EJQ4_9BILA